MPQPLANFARHLLTAGFLVGLASFVLKLLDDNMSETTKGRFNAWASRFSSSARAANAESVYQWLKAPSKHPGRKAILGIAGISAFYYVLFFLQPDPGGPPWYEIPLVSGVMYLMFLAVWGKIFSFDSFADAEVGTKALGSLYSLILIGVLVAIQRHRGRPLLPFGGLGDATRVDYLIWAGFGFLSIGAAGLLLQITPYLIVWLIQYPIIAGGRLLWRLATSPKGAWAALFYVVTTGFGECVLSAELRDLK